MYGLWSGSGGAMGDIVNLRQVRKARDRAIKAQEADANRAKFGRTKAERLRDTQEASKQIRTIEGHRLEKEGDKDS